MRQALAVATIGVAAKAVQPMLSIDSALNDISPAGACSYAAAPTSPNPAYLTQTNWPYAGDGGSNAVLIYNDCSRNVYGSYYQYPACVIGDDACDGGGQVNNNNGQQKNCLVNTNGQHSCKTAEIPDAGFLSFAQGRYQNGVLGEMHAKTGWY